MTTVSPELRFELDDLYTAYAGVPDDGPLEDWPRFFVDPCDYQLIPRENYECGLPLAVMKCESTGMLMDRVRSVQELLMYEPRYLRHMISNVRIQEVVETNTRLKVVANYAVLETLRDDFTRVLNAGRYIDQIVRDADGALKFAVKHCVYDSELVPNSITHPV
ncbi:MAG: salicylate hydroxylase [Alphaproteobacteria bacterium]|nr:salicylate hydroxylase [Alphaproteobacteria bacterium]